MFDNIGGKIKTLAKVICWIGIIASCIWGVYLWIKDDGFFSGLGAIIGGVLGSWLSSWTTYGIGEAAENSEAALLEQRAIQKKLDQVLREVKGIDSNKEKPAESAEYLVSKTDVGQIVSIGKEFLAGRCEICDKSGVTVNMCQIKGLDGSMRHLIVCKNCQARHSTPSGQ